MSQQNNPLSLISLNANGLGETNKINQVFEWLKTFHKATNKIVFLQETHTTEKIEETWRDEWNDSHMEVVTAKV